MRSLDKHKYATTTDDEGVNYRDIAEVMTKIGFKMNHSSARNHVLRVMRKFAKALSESHGVELDEQQVDFLARSAAFQQRVSVILHNVEANRRARERSSPGAKNSEDC